MVRLLRGYFDGYVAALFGTVILASVLPCRGIAAHGFAWLTNAAIVLLFFLHGAKLSRDAVISGALAWRLHLTVMTVTFVLFPILGVATAQIAAPIVGTSIAAGLLFLTLLPSTVQSSIAFTAMAEGNVPAAVCSASFSNLIGIFVTPLLVTLLMHTSGGSSGGGSALQSVEAIALQLLLPFVSGHLLRPWIHKVIAAHKGLTTMVDRGSILLVVYTAFSAAVVEGLWHTVSVATLCLIGAFSVVMLALVLVTTYAVARLQGLPRADGIVLIFCGSKKSLASGVPMAGVLFPTTMIGPVILPLMIFHQIQLIACAIIARRFARQARRAAILADAPARPTPGQG